jgi:competence protein ComEC
VGWHVVFCDVGQGDAAVVRVGDDSAIVIDTGPDPNIIDHCLSDLGVSQIPYVLLTHFHADHVEGLPGVLKGRAVGEVLVSPLAEPADEASRVQHWCEHDHIPERVVTAGDRRRVGEVDSTLIWPQRIIRGQGSDPNNSSLTALVTVAGIRLLFGGDLETAAQDAVINAVGFGGVDVVKVPHHGSRKQSPRLVTWLKARVAVISVGANNDYGHPAPQTIAAYRAHGITVWRTDQSGDIAVLGSGNSISVVGRAGEPCDMRC